MESDDFLSLDHSCIKKVLSDDDLNVSSEEVAYEALIKWVKASPDERQSTLPDLLCEVRMIYLPIHYIVSQVDTEELIVSSKACLALMNQVKSYHLLARKGSESPNLKTRPRNQLNFDLYGIFMDVACGYSLKYFDFGKKVWHVLASNKVKCGEIESVVALNDIIYVFFQTTVQTFHLKTLEWEALETKRESVQGSAIVSDKNRIYCFGAWCTDYMQKVRCFNTQLNEWLEEGKINTCRGYLAAASLEDSIYVTGGHKYMTGCHNYAAGWYVHPEIFKIVEKYNILTGVCSDATPMLSPRFGHGCCAMNGRVYVCGGSQSSSTAEVYDPETNQWEFISSVKNLAYCNSLLSHLNKLYACGESMQVYDAEKNKWEMLVSHPGRGFQCAVWGPSAIPKP